MSFDFLTVAEDLEAYLKPLLPQKWRIQNANKPAGKVTGVALTYLQRDVSADAVGGTQIPVGTLGVGFDLQLSTPETDTTKGFARLTTEVLHLFRALDQSPYVSWSNAERGVLETGESTYTIPVTVLTTYNTQE